MVAPSKLLPTAPTDKWWHPSTGWGLVLPDDDRLSREQKVTAAGAGPALERRYSRRRTTDGQITAKVLRYRSVGLSAFTLCDYEHGADVPIAGTPVGVGDADITRLMRDAMGVPLPRAYREDPDMRQARFIEGPAASAASLTQALASRHPAIVVTTSHGYTGIGDPQDTRRRLGLPVDQNRQLVDPAALLTSWAPDGAIWYAHACCSAGADERSAYADLFDAGSDVGRTLTAATAAGATTAPLPQALLGARRPLRGFFGHVEPTFDWTIRFPDTGQRLASGLRDGLYTAAGLGEPLGRVLRRYYEPVGSLLVQHAAAVQNYTTAAPERAGQFEARAAYHKVTAIDRVSTVLLGDPTAFLPVPRRTPAPT